MTSIAAQGIRKVKQLYKANEAKLEQLSLQCGSHSVAALQNQFLEQLGYTLAEYEAFPVQGTRLAIAGGRDRLRYPPKAVTFPQLLQINSRVKLYPCFQHWQQEVGLLYLCFTPEPDLSGVNPRWHKYYKPQTPNQPCPFLEQVLRQPTCGVWRGIERLESLRYPTYPTFRG